MPTLLATFFIFLITLQSFYFSNIGASIFPVIGSIGIFALSIRRFRAAPIKRFKLILISFCLFSTFQISIDIYLDSYYKGFLSFPVLFCCMIGAILFFDNRLYLLKKVIKYVIILHLLFLFLQILVWFGTGEYLDYLYLVTGEAQHYMSQKGIVINGERTPRFTGLFNEPGTYSTWIFSLVLIYYFLQRKISYLLILSLVSMVITMSLYGILLSFLFCLLVLFKRVNIKRAFLVLPIYILILLIIPDIERRLSGEYAGIAFRLTAIKAIFDPLTFFGGRLFNETLNKILLDVSIPVYLVYQGGVVYLAFFLSVFIAAGILHSPLIFFGSLLLLMSKIKITYPLIWFFISSIFMIRQQRSSTSVSHKLIPKYSCFQGKINYDKLPYSVL